MWIETSQGPRRVRDLIGKPFVAVVGGELYAAPYGFIPTGLRPILRVTTARGYSIRATAVHKVLVETGRRLKIGGGYNEDREWIRIDELEPGIQLVLDASPFLIGRTDTKKFDLGWLLGEMVGDGGYNPEKKYNGYVRFWGEHAKFMAERATGIIKTHLTPRLDFKGSNWSEANGSLTVSSSELSHLANHLIEPGTKAGTDLLETMPQDFVRGFLSGLFDSDGSVQGTVEKGVSIRLSQSDLSRLQMVQRMLLRLGITSTIYCNRREAGDRLLPDGKGGKRGYASKANHELHVSKSALSLFRDVIGLHKPDKVNRLNQVLAGRKRPLYRDRFATKVVGVDADGVEPVYECTVEGINWVVSNGLVASNSG